jgi:BirA family biotin operon repressor/biotin-[acetyl-CoA-carboxylase] ligase
MAIDLDYLATRLPGRSIEWHASIGSTMIEAARRAATGCAHGTVVGADEQTAGIGRYGRHWHSEAEAGIYLSIVLRLPFGIETLPLVTLALGLAVSEAIHKVTDLACDLRWPNDVLIGGKKCCGILTQLDRPAVIAGIGINVNHAAFPDEISQVATSLRIASGRTHSREHIIAELLPAIDNYCGILETQGRDPILRMFSQASSYVAGRRVTVDQGDCVLQGVTAGLNASGFLLLRDDRGKQHHIIAGGVRPCS